MEGLEQAKIDLAVFGSFVVHVAPDGERTFVPIRSMRLKQLVLDERAKHAPSLIRRRDVD